jgi:hypothetical protein
MADVIKYHHFREEKRLLIDRGIQEDKVMATRVIFLVAILVMHGVSKKFGSSCF